MAQAETPAGGLLAGLVRAADAALEQADAQLGGGAGEARLARQPIHSVYVPAQLLGLGPGPAEELPARWGDAAIAELMALAGAAGPQIPEDTGEGAAVAGAQWLARSCGLSAAIAPAVARAVVAKLGRSPIEDLRIDLEDGFTQRGIPAADRAADEDAAVIAAAQTIAAWLAPAESRPARAPWFCGVRVKSFGPETRARSLRSLALLLERLSATPARAQLGLDLRRLRLTLPKVQHRDQVTAFVAALSRLEEAFQLPRLGFEIQIEAPEAIIGTAGEAVPARLLAAGEGRVLALHYGTYDYSASLGVDAAYQALDHPVADFAKDLLQVVVAGTGVELSDGSTNLVPTGETDAKLAAWRTHFSLVTRHLSRGIRQGWDLHPLQLITRALGTTAYFRSDWEHCARRLADYVRGDTGRWLDEPATAKALAGFLLRGHGCGALTDEELARYGLGPAPLRQLAETGLAATGATGAAVAGGREQV